MMTGDDERDEQRRDEGAGRAERDVVREAEAADLAGEPVEQEVEHVRRRGGAWGPGCGSGVRRGRGATPAHGGEVRDEASRAARRATP
jgi:hypothetical protein